MKNLFTYITEKFIINKNTKTDNQPIQAPDKISIEKNKLFIDIRNQKDSLLYLDKKKLEQYYLKKSNPVRLIKSIKDQWKLLRRFYLSIFACKWPEYAIEAKKQLIIRGYYTRQEVEDYIAFKYSEYCTYDNPNNENILKILKQLLKY